MSPAELEKYLHNRIPLSKAMEVSVVSVSADAVVLRAPLAPNINHRETVFGGSASTLAILAAWSLLQMRLSDEGINDIQLVIQRSAMEYEKPIFGEFTAKASMEYIEGWATFTRMLARKGKGRVTVKSVLEHAGQIVGRLSGEFVALSAQTSQ